MKTFTTYTPPANSLIPLIPVPKIVRKSYRGWGYVNRLKQIGPQMQYGRGLQLFTKPLFVVKTAQKPVINAMKTVINSTKWEQPASHTYRQPKLSFSFTPFSVQSLAGQRTPPKTGELVVSKKPQNDNNHYHFWIVAQFVN